MKFVWIIPALAAALSAGGCTPMFSGSGFGSKPGVEIPHCYRSAPPSGGCVGND